VSGVDAERSHHLPEAAKVVIVTGASGGVGRGIALACGAAGWDVWIAARRQAEGQAVADEVTAAGGCGHAVVCDVADEQSVDALIDEVAATSGRLDGLVHNATSGLSSQACPIPDITVDDLADHVRVATRALYLLARRAHPLLADSRGSVVLTTSEAGFEGKRLLAAYSLVKAQQRGLLRALAREWGPTGVRVNAIAPLATSPAIEKAFVSDPAMEARVMGRNPMRRLGDPVDDIGPVVRFLLSDDAAYVTGQTVMVDGGACSVT
jgi:3-oxoacyl-[acyl-carrier protein] reductase